jgi:hypothetical protein
MRLKVLFAVVIPLIVILVVTREVRLAQRLAAVAAGTQTAVDDRAAALARLEQLEAEVDELKANSEIASTLRSNAALPQALSRVAALEAQLRSLATAARATAPSRPSVPEYDPTKPPPPDTSQPAPSSAPPKRGWGPEQLTGPPDTDKAGDIQTAWASREPDAGSEWLWVDFERPTPLAEVRIRETFNPGAISKVTAVVNGQEVLLWEGTAAGGQAPRDFVVPVRENISAGSVVVHLDTSRVEGWNEIDAVELVGRDGSRQWASAVNASSTYADRSGNTTATDSGDQAVILTKPFIPAQDR